MNFEWRMSFNTVGKTLEAQSAEYTIYDSEKGKSYFFQVPASSSTARKERCHVFFDPDRTEIEWVKDGKVVKSLKVMGKAQISHEGDFLYFWCDGELY